MMHTSFFLMTALATLATAHPLLSSRQSTPCFVIGSVALPQEVIDTDDAIASSITCSGTDTTISGVPDVTSGSTTFSSINFEDSSDSPLGFALSSFATVSPLADNSLSNFTDALNVYEATEAGIRSVGGSLAVKIPKFFLAFQVARIKTAQGVEITDAGQTVEHLLGKVQSNAAGDPGLDEVATLATVLS
ncbi:hypothetical protein UCRPC4_g05572 [Phaeomoniella chlamydospora]|uniref:DUF7143 domain-containing protein n=1 Tax=Phaeomoniella chlamydospora TaxID=158046 RepID=A0A0G2GKJ6_PHACM|nr:hypothetical protein UCRPC4_g05572 [Phaeomoniella chlamydospora]